jgi:hypothetical protein
LAFFFFSDFDFSFLFSDFSLSFVGLGDFSVSFSVRLGDFSLSVVVDFSDFSDFSLSVEVDFSLSFLGDFSLSFLGDFSARFSDLVLVAISKGSAMSPPDFQNELGDE